jgi:hypothetical protein
MMRSIAAVVVGYLTMLLITFVSLTVAYQVLGADGAFKPGVYEASSTWIGISLVLGLVTAIVGGWVCKVLGRTSAAVYGLVGLVVVIGLASAIFTMMAPAAEQAARPAGVSMLEAMKHARQPVWLAFLFPVIGAIGVLLGGSLKKES